MDKQTAEIAASTVQSLVKALKSVRRHTYAEELVAAAILVVGNDVCVHLREITERLDELKVSCE